VSTTNLQLLLARELVEWSAVS